MGVHASMQTNKGEAAVVAVVSVAVVAAEETQVAVLA